MSLLLSKPWVPDSLTRAETPSNQHRWVGGVSGRKDKVTWAQGGLLLPNLRWIIRLYFQKVSSIFICQNSHLKVLMRSA